MTLILSTETKGYINTHAVPLFFMNKIHTLK